MRRVLSLVLAVLVMGWPLAAVYISAGAWFIPDPALRLPAVALGVAYFPVAMLSIALATQSPVSVGAKIRKLGWRQWAALTIPVLVFGYGAYLGFYIALPEFFTDIVGRNAQHAYVVRSVFVGTRRLSSCNHQMSLESSVSRIDGTFCITPPFAKKITVGQSIALKGKESALGFRFLIEDQ